MMFSLSASAQTDATNHTILIDNSGSMKGKPAKTGNLDIWQPTKNNIKNYIDIIEVGNTITLYSFDSYLSSKSTFLIRDESDTENAKDFVDDLTASGGNTCLYSSLYKALDNLEKDTTKYDKQIFYIFTDLVQACKDEPFNIENIKGKFDLAKSNDLEHLYYISLGKDIPKEIEDWSEKDTTVTSTSKNPIIEDIFPEINIDPNLINVNFSKKRTVEVLIPLIYTKQLVNTKMEILLNCENNKIELLTNNVLLSGNSISLKFQIDNLYYSVNNEQGELHFKTTTQTKLRNDKVSVNFIIPKKRKIIIEIN